MQAVKLPQKSCSTGYQLLQTELYSGCVGDMSTYVDFLGRKFPFLKVDSSAVLRSVVFTGS